MSATKQSDEKLKPVWRAAEVIAERLDISVKVTDNVIEMLEEGATIPFIARYRKERTKGLEVDKLREISTVSEELKVVENKIATVHQAIKKTGKLSKDLVEALKHAQSLDEVDTLFAPFKPGHKGTLAERARKLGLEPMALKILDGRSVDLSTLVNKNEKSLKTVGDVEKGIQHIIADIIAKDKGAIQQARNICKSNKVILECHKCKNTTKAASVEKKVGDSKKKDDSYKYEQYYDYKIPVHYLKPHQILAINRGEDKKVLTVKIVIPEFIKNQFISYCQRKWCRGRDSAYIENSIEDAYDRLIVPQCCRSIRSELTKKAEEASIKVFADNLKSLLLQPTVKGKTVLGIDPGFSNGCKSAVISPTGQILATVVLYLHDHRSNKSKEKDKLIDTVIKHRCEVIAIGNGVGCRETEKFVSDLIQSKHFKPLEVYYSIVDESGASIYSVSPEAQKELPDLDPTLRGAVSISRRLQDPLAELVKIEPKHIGVGMYQHDIAEGKLKISLDSVIEECVSFVGVDLNTGSECLLRRIAGLSSAKAKKIIEWRDKNNRFINRQQLLSVKGLGQKSFEQCAGFVRILNTDNSNTSNKTDSDIKTEVKPNSIKRKTTTASTSKTKKQKMEADLEPNPLDMTPIHPESYHIATSFIADVGEDINHIGRQDFIQNIKSFLNKHDVSDLTETYSTGEPTLVLITEALTKTKSYDIREGNQKPLFKQGITGIEDLKIDSILTGRVTNVTHFGAFVDVGVGNDALIHSSKMCTSKGRQTLHLGDRVQVRVLNVEAARKRISVALVDIL
ncbi:S1 RNA-binding domain-containing protein 1 [Patella vulgata]|uniref:S1 RNA-binding domain-containing protein 1 n=1 Tax=Patella vulgata TaxID=6465 RepID=UPI00217F4868|nr:S1 RNA-binding domain-containing protein 1 [Patella vulgata]